MNEVLDLTPEMVNQERRDEAGRRIRVDRRHDAVTVKGWPADKNRRSGEDRRSEDRRKRCIHCGNTYTLTTMGQPTCGCRLNAFQNPGGG